MYIIKVTWHFLLLDYARLLPKMGPLCQVDYFKMFHSCFCWWLSCSKFRTNIMFVFHRQKKMMTEDFMHNPERRESLTFRVEVLYLSTRVIVLVILLLCYLPPASWQRIYPNCQPHLHGSASQSPFVIFSCLLRDGCESRHTLTSPSDSVFVFDENSAC